MKRFINGYSFTDEQNKIVDFTTVDRKNLVVNSYAGASKSTSSLAVAKEFRGRTLYTVFGNRNAKDFAKDGSRYAAVHSNYALAHKAVGYKYRQQERLAETTKHVLAAIIDSIGKSLKTQEVGGYMIDKNMQAYDIFRMINQFCYSIDDEIGIQHGVSDFIYPDESEDIKDRLEEAYYGHLLPRAKYIWGQMRSFKTSFPVTHDCYLKIFALSRPKLPYDLIIADEFQDVNPVFAKIVRDQQCQKLIVGDNFQSIFGWRNAVNAMGIMGIDNTLPLSKSFRFGTQIGDVAHDIIEFQLGQDIGIQGFEKIQTNIHVKPREFRNKTIICRTNGECVKHLVENQGYGKVKIIGDMATTVKTIKGILSLRGKKNNPKKVVYGPLSIFKSYQELFEYSRTPAGAEIGMLINVMNKAQKMSIDAIKLCDILQSSAKTRNPDITITTGHKSKGLEFDVVELGSDMRRPVDKGWNHEDANLLYVAATRAKKDLLIAKCPAILECLDLPFTHLLEKKK